MTMPAFTKIPEECPVVIPMDHIAAFHPWVHEDEMCVKVCTSGGHEILVSECMADIKKMLPKSFY